VRRVTAVLLSFVLILSLLPALAVAAPSDAGATASSDGGAPDWAREASIYHVFVDRFRDGDPANPDVDTSLDFSEALKSWMGGDIAGVIEGLDHIEALGFDTIWLGPVYDNAYFHGYHPVDFLEVDDNFGDLPRMRALVDEVHRRDMRIVYDFVPNHTSDQHEWFQEVLEQCEASDHYSWYRFETCDAETGTYVYDAFYDIPELPELDLDHPAARAYMLDDVVPFYLDDIGFDGFRIDYAKGPSLDFWAEFRDTVTAVKPDAFTFGEVWSPRAEIAGYQDAFDGAVNFPLQSALTDTLARDNDLAQLDQAVRADQATYDDDFVLTTFLDNHDVSRFVYQAGGGEEGRERLKVALTAQFALPGTPIVYQGTEIGMGQTANTPAAGGGWVDRWFREPMPWSPDHWAHSESEGFVLQGWHEDVADRVSDLNHLRATHPSLTHGTYAGVHAAGDLMLFERLHADERTLTVLNRGGAREVDLAALYETEIPDEVTLDALLGAGSTESADGDLTVALDGSSAEVFTVTGPLPDPLAPPEPREGPEFAVIHYQRDAGDEHEWGVHPWGDIIEAESRDWPDHKPFTGETDYGRFTWLELEDGAEEVGIVVGRTGTDQKDPDADLEFDPRVSPEIWIRQGDPTIYTSEAAAQGHVTIRYQLPEGDDGDGLALHLWGDALAEDVGTDWEAPRPLDGTDAYGAYWQVPVDDVDEEVGFIVRRHGGKEIEDDLFLTPSETPSAWLRTGDPTIHASRGAALNLAVLHYHRPEGDYGDVTSDDYHDFWGLHTWGGAPDPGWDTPRKPVREDGFGQVFEVPLNTAATTLNYILHRGDEKDLPEDQTLHLGSIGHEVWILAGREGYLLPMAPGMPTDPIDPVEPVEPSDSPPYAVIHYQRDAGDEHEWGVHPWGDIIEAESRDWPDHKPFTGETDYGRFTWLELEDGAEEVGIVVGRTGTDQKDPDADLEFDPRVSPEIWIRQGDPTIYTSEAAAQGHVTIRYQLPEGDDGDGLALHLWGDALAEDVGTDWEAPRPLDGTDAYGAYWQVPVDDVDEEVGFIVRRHGGKEIEDDLFLTPSETPSAWLRTGDPTIHASRGAALNLAVLHYHRPAGDYGAWEDETAPYTEFWGLHTWGGAADPGWTTPRRPVRQDGFGLVFEVPLFDGATSLNYLLHKGDEKDLPDDQSLDLARFGHEVWILSGVEEYLLPITPAGGSAEANLGQQRAHFVSSDHIAWPFETPADATYELHHAPEGGLELVDGDIVGGEAVELGYNPDGLPTSITSTDGYLHLADREALTVPDDLDLDLWLTGQLAVSATSADGRLLAATSLQLPGVLDERYATDDDLGVVWDGDVPGLHLWAPTAKSVTAHVYDTSTSEEPAASETMTRDGGVWSVTGEPSWDRAFYLYEVEVYVPSTGQIEHNWVTDPYSFSLAMDSTRSQIVRLSDGDLKPAGWDALDKPAFAGQEQLSVYELHVRDFSANDATVPEEDRGKYTAFTLEGTDGIEHLRALADAGLTHLHLLPTFDIATIIEDPVERVEPDITMPEDPASEVPQATLDPVRDLDAFNWGYDPFHFTAPEGSYSTDPDGEQRIREYRDMVGSLSELGLRMVKDVVYNHTNSAGQSDKSVLDRIVPGYYQRLSDTGVVETSTCCPNTATEHLMMEKLTIDSVLTWATEYKVDGFRFDLMGHHPKAQMERLRAELDALTLEEHGVDGERIVLYGEGWNFGEVADDARFVQATQANMAGTGIGTFNDRLRDAARGGNPFGGLQEQGFVTGLAVDPNGVLAINEDPTRARVFADNVRIGMAGNLADYTFEAADGTLKAGRELDYGGSPAGYTEVTTDNVVYVSKHDNETLFDAIQYKLPLDTSLDERARVQNLGLSVVALSQGTPFFHGGSDLMRSKSLDRDSYNSGDWFNRIFWDRSFNNWGVGLPPAEKNADNWPLMTSLLDELEAPGPAQIDRTAAHFQELLEIRASTDLFNLVTLEEVQEQLAFHATGPDAPLGVIAMSLTGGTGVITDVLVVVNAGVDEITIDDADVPSGAWELHPVQATSFDEVVRSSTVSDGAFTVPARTTAVFVQLDEPVDDDRPGHRPPHAGDPGPPPHAGVPGKPPHAGLPAWVPGPPASPPGRPANR
jgi:pullulanase-type alpha-1,6-glucosidase